MKFFSDRTYRFLRALVLAVLRIAHPCVKVRGRENIPEGPVIFCCNHSAFTDPIWLVGHANLPTMPRVMAKQELTRVPVVGWILGGLKIIPVDRDSSDLTAIKTSMKTLKEGNKMVIFPEGTRVRNGKESVAHIGAVMLSVRTNTKIMPCYLTANKRFFGKIDIVYGEPYLPQTSCPKPSNEELEQLSAKLLKTIYAMGEEL
ncbi:MAG: 1-acyl-sn-glycerol-3-phosphate acyltransferase [Oscillospiraceae bacterium]|nr:1-acyl-sn-glycerol-3-phosphate acyltransferase [Oscillospiraceae bacterium]